MTFLITLESPGGDMIGFLGAEQEEANDFVILHIIYVLPDFRKCRYGKALLEFFDKLMNQAKMKKIKLVVLNRVSHHIVLDISSASNIEYEIIVPNDEILDNGDQELDAK